MWQLFLGMYILGKKKKTIKEERVGFAQFVTNGEMELSLCLLELHGRH